MSAEYKLSVEFMENRQFEDAIRILNEFLENQPNDEKALLNKSICLYNLNRFQESIDIARNIVQFFPENIRAYQILAYAYDRQNQFNLGLDSINLALELDKSNVESYKIQSLLQMKLQMYTESGKSLQNALKIEPNNWMLHHDLAVAHQKAGDISGALFEYRQALKIYPSIDTFSSLLITYLLKFRIIYTIVFLLLFMLSVCFKSVIFLIPFWILMLCELGISIRNKNWKALMILLVILICVTTIFVGIIYQQQKN